jgi:hypothetical protein
MIYPALAHGAGVRDELRRKSGFHPFAVILDSNQGGVGAVPQWKIPPALGGALAGIL